MSQEAHNDPSMFWLKFFFICFAGTVLAIGVWAAWPGNYDPNYEPKVTAGGGHH